ncbi:SoxR reducing system RseC family protein [Alistipes sp.]|uniref:SoxR reducing system RseC family protein n=1 Tax=Alistipes sp. TaxID=1872444 RepID=UPI003A86F419
MDSGIIEHEGIVESVQKDGVHVKITSRSACGACQARQACGMAETQEKIIVVPTSDAAQYLPGENVLVGVRKKAGRIAVMLAYGGALVVLLAALVVSIVVLGAGDGVGLVAALGSVAVYYLLLWLFRRRIEHTIQFTITKI